MTGDRTNRGFTLTEMIVVIVVLGIVGGILAGFIYQATRAYEDTKRRTELVARARTAMDRLASEVLHAVPNSIQVLAGGTGIEFVTAAFGGRLVHATEDFGNRFKRANRRFLPNVTRHELYSVGTGKPATSGAPLVIANGSPSDLISGATWAALSDIVPANQPQDGTTEGQVLQFSNKRFPYDTPSRHYQVIDYTHEVGLTAGSLHWHRTSGLNGYDGSAGWSAADPVLVDGVNGVTFRYFPGSAQSGGILGVILELSERGESITLLREIHVRNTP